MTEVYEKLYSLQDFLKPENYKTYDELSMKLNKVLGIDAGHAPAAAPVMNEAPAAQPVNDPAPFADTEDSSSDEDDTLSYFAKLAKES